MIGRGAVFALDEDDEGGPDGPVAAGRRPREPGAGRANVDFHGPRTCTGAAAREAATMLHRALGLPEPDAVSAHWAPRRLRSVDYRTGEKPVQE